jgi:beta-carotene 3-hydroxylase
LIMTILMNISLVIAAFLLMECVAWLTHKYLMHGLLWALHRDHHSKEQHGFFERNDFFFLIFALPGIACLAAGSAYGIAVVLWIGIGITMYGLCYFLVHDVFIHQRFNVFRNTDNRYLKGIRRAHKMHHKHLDKNDGECFGMLWVPFKYYIDSVQKTAE